MGRKKLFYMGMFSSDKILSYTVYVHVLLNNYILLQGTSISRAIHFVEFADLLAFVKLVFQKCSLVHVHLEVTTEYEIIFREICFQCHFTKSTALEINYPQSTVSIQLGIHVCSHDEVKECSVKGHINNSDLAQGSH